MGPRGSSFLRYAGAIVAAIAFVLLLQALGADVPPGFGAVVAILFLAAVGFSSRDKGGPRPGGDDVGPPSTR